MSPSGRVAIYDRWLHVLGGGERYACMLARALAELHDVTLLTHRPVGRATLENRLNVDLEGVAISTLRYCPSYEAVSQASSKFDLFINGSHRDFVFPRAPSNALIVFFPADPSSYQPAVDYPRWARPRRVLGRIWLRHRLRAMTDDAAGRSPAKMVTDAVGRYQILIAISEYSARWTSRLWGRDCEVLYPSIPSDLAVVAPRQNVILSVGRFFPGQHNKKHGAMIDTFRSLRDRGLLDWEYHVVGGLETSNSSHRAYLADLRRMARGYPIKFHVNVDADRLRRLYATAALFWHATGFGEDREADPERFEHFGLSTLEAMATGCVPIVFGHAGQAEIVRDGKSGLLWSTLYDLAEATRRVIDDPDLAGALRSGAETRAAQFGDTLFLAKADAIFSPLIASARKSVALVG